MVGTAALPHILMRYYTTPSVKEARESVTWSLFFIFLLYFHGAGAGGACVKYQVFNVACRDAVRPAARPGSANWAAVDPSPLSVTDVNKDGILQLARSPSAATSSCWRPRRSPACPTWCRAWWRPAAWRGAVHRRRPAADHRQRAVARPVLQDDRPEPRAPARRVSISKMLLVVAPGGGLRGGAETAGHPVPGLGGVRSRRRPSSPHGARHLLEARQQVGASSA